MKIVDIVKNGNMASFSHFCDGILYYTVEFEGKTYMFKIETDTKEVGVGVFPASIKAITLMRWIRKSIDKNEFIET